MQTLTDSRLWQYGPTWLAEESQWPRWKHSEILHLQASLDDTEPPANTEVTSVHHTGVGEIMDIHHYSTLSKLLRVSAYVLRFVYNCKQSSSDQRHTGKLKPSEIDESACSWIRHTQQTSFPVELSTLKSNARISHHSPLARQLKLFLNSKQIICCCGRIHNANVDSNTKFPCLLPKKHPLTALIINQVHQIQLHSGVNATCSHGAATEVLGSVG